MSDVDHPELPDLLQEDGVNRSVWTRLGLVVAAVVFLALGVIGWLIPIISGIPFYVAGLVMLGMASRRVAHQINRAERHLPYKVRKILRWHRRKRDADP
jgi:uncharacterized membrane protein YbaN (DUF454 family)